MVIVARENRKLFHVSSEHVANQERIDHLSLLCQPNHLRMPESCSVFVATAFLSERRNILVLRLSP